MIQKTVTTRSLLIKTLTISNCLTALRLPLALLFFVQNTVFRLIVVFLAMVSDSIDGYVARKRKSASHFGAILDPAMDKFFVYCVLGILYMENRILLWELFAALSRDAALCIYGLFVSIAHGWSKVVLRPIRWGKITTAMQFLMLLALAVGFSLPPYLYALFIIIGGLVLLELFISGPIAFLGKKNDS